MQEVKKRWLYKHRVWEGSVQKRQRDRQEGCEHLERGSGLVIVGCLLGPQEDPSAFPPYKTQPKTKY